jgi:hypothetical protein
MKMKNEKQEKGREERERGNIQNNKDWPKRLTCGL